MPGISSVGAQNIEPLPIFAGGEGDIPSKLFDQQHFTGQSLFIGR
jgi:hypothetical protein